MNEETILLVVGAVITLANPAITALVVNARARELVKVGVSLVLAVIGGGLIAWSQHGDGADWPTLILAAFGAAQLIYKAANARFKDSTGLSLNEQEWAAPTRGLG